MAGNYLVNIQKLKGRENYGDWKFAVENFLVLEGISKCIEEVVAADDAKAKAKLILTIDTSLYVHIKDAKTTVDLWKKLKTLFDDSGFARKITLLRNLISIRLENCESMVSYVNQIVETGQKLEGTGFKIDDEWIGSLLLAGLPDKFAPMIMAIEHSGIAITTDAIRTKLLDIEGDITSSGSAFASKSWHGNKRNVGSNSISRKEIRCYRCKQVGHFKNKCPKGSSKNNDTSQQLTNAFSAVFLNGTFNKSDWYVDSGASVHLTPNREHFVNNCKQINMKEIMVANKTKLPVLGTGDINLTTVVSNQSFDITVKNVFHVPELTTNLLSVSQLIKNGNEVKFENSGCKIYNMKNSLVATADLMDGVYRLNILHNENCLLTTSAKSTGETWHRRFGHINYGYLNKTKGLVDGLSYTGEIKPDSLNCEVCCEAKQSRLPFLHKGNRAEDLLQIVHADVCGPMENLSIGGSKYFLIIEDDFSRMAFVYFLKTKNEAFECFKQFKSLVENQVNKKIKVFRTDNGGEFCSNQFEEFLKANGVIHQKTNPHTPEQNGMCERLNRTVVEKAKCLLFDADLKKKFWAEAVNTAVYLRNRSIASGLQKTPYELWTGVKPDVSNLRIFGSKVMVHIPKQNRLKWDKKAVKQILIGYSDNVKGYRVYNPSNNTVSTSRDVTIFEDVEKKISITIGKEADQKISNENADSVGAVEDDDINKTESESESESFDDANEDSDFMSDREVDTEVVRKSERTAKPKLYKDYVTYFCTSGNLDDDPMTVEEAMSRPDADRWRQAMKEELHSFEENQAWELADIPDSDTVVHCKWVFKRKRDSENKVRYRARLVAKGFTQKPGIDFDETFSPVVRHSTLRLLIALSVKLDLNIFHFDVTTAFLNGVLKENVFMTVPEGLELFDNKNKVLKLKKAIYGLKQSSRAWNERINVFLLKLDYKKSEIEPCLYIKKQDNYLTIIALYVDDFFIFSNDNNSVKFLERQLRLEFKIKNLGQAKQILGVRLNRDHKNDCITLDQERYIEQLLRKFNMIDCKTVSTPMNVSCNNETKICDKEIPYQRLIGSLMYLAVLTRPDIAYTVSYLSQFNNCYTEYHWKCAKHVLRYLKGTKGYSLKFTKDDSILLGFADADWASNTEDRKSYTGFVFKLSGAAVAWESRKQKTVALSSTEAEYMALCEASKEAIYLKNLMFELIGFDDSVVIFNDNQGAQKLSPNPVFHKRSKHIDVRHHFVREAISNKLVEVKYLSTIDMTADILTKGLSADKNAKFVKNLGLHK